VNRLQKFVEKGADGSARVAYALGAEKLPPAQAGAQWLVVDDFNAGDELLENMELKDAFKAAIDTGCAVLPLGIGR
jgi:hypothetical protein